MTHADCLFEIGCEELPTLSLQPLIQALAHNVQTLLTQANIDFQDIMTFVTPRRLALVIKQLADQQPDQTIERKGPAVNAPIQAQQGFAKNCGVSIAQLKTQQSGNDIYYIYHTVTPGQSIIDVLPSLIEKSLQNLPIQKRMRWGDNPYEFVRPVHWAVLLYGKTVINTTIFGCQTDRISYGHRFHSPEKIQLEHANDYCDILRKHYVLADWQTRKDTITNQIMYAAAQINANAVIDPRLLDEVCGLVEWPKALLVKFDARFLNVPQEALISSMRHHQKCFHVTDENNTMLPYFITVTNIESHNPEQVITGNQRVMSARLSDAEFFYQTDLKTPLTDYREEGRHVLFQKQLGSVYEKCERIALLARTLTNSIHADPEQTYQAGLFCKADLVTEMVKEFPELQGTMGYYYSIAQGYDAAFARALRDYYLPRFSGDTLPDDAIACAVAIADRIDTIVGIFGINHAPTGEKDPFALRRAALGILRILIEKALPVNVYTLLQHAVENYAGKLLNPLCVNDCFQFMMDRLRAWYLEKGITPDVFAAVFANVPQQPFDFHQRLLAVQKFRDLPESNALAAANKRVSKLLIKEQQLEEQYTLNANLFDNDYEQHLADMLAKCQQHVEPLFAQHEYTTILTTLAQLRDPVDAFFDHVMVMVNDKNIRHNRLALLNQLRQLFLRVADISLLQW
jgi:glycyl-tRNA synthetase beta chain